MSLIIKGLFFKFLDSVQKMDKKSKKMRLRFEQQLKLGIVPISEVQLNTKSRHGLVPVLRALQYVFKTKELNEQIFEILEEEVKSGVQETGRFGMSLWEILVLGVVRLNENMDYDGLHDLANEHNALRGILGIQHNDYTSGKQYALQTIKDNVRLLSDEKIYEISEIIVSGAHGLIKKKEGAEGLNLRIKADSFVVESDIHFPTDLNLLWDSLRKSLEKMHYFQLSYPDLPTRFKCVSWRNKARRAYRISSEIHRKKGANYQPRLEKAVKSYLSVGEQILTRGEEMLKELLDNELFISRSNRSKNQHLLDLTYYLKMVEKHLDLVNRRIILGETIPHSEKVFSIFEPHVEWNSKGKVNKSVELGHNVLIATDQYQYILYGQVYEHQVDKERTIDLSKKLEEKYGTAHELESLSLDRNFYSLAAEKALQHTFKTVVLPKPGRKSQLELAQEENEDYQKVKRAHSGVEGNINQLEQNGLDICRDKGIDGFKRYVAYGILSYNLHRLGSMLIQAERKEEKRALKRRKKRLAA